MTRPVEMVDDAQATARALLALGHAKYEQFRAAVGASTVLPWDQLDDGARLGWAKGLEHFIPVVLAAGEERRHRARFLVGARDTTDGQGDDCCLDSCGPWECTRKPHSDAPHAAGTGGVIVAAWELS